MAAVLRSLLQLAQVAILARLLSPADYGLMAIIGVMLGFAGLFADLGVNCAFMHKREITAEQRSSLYWTNVAVSGTIVAIVAAASPLLAAFFGDERLMIPMILSASTFVLSALGQQVKLVAEKELNFRPVVLLETFSAVAGFGVAVVTALAGWGVYALVASGIVSAFLNTVLAWVYLARGWRPMLRLRLSDVRPFLGFGGAVVANAVVNQINSTVDLILGGRLLGAAQLGLYSVPRNLAFQIQMTINPIITRVGFPLIAEVQSDVARVRTIYLKTMNMTASTNAPVYLGIAFFAPEIVAILLGSGWERSGDLLRILALWGGIRSTGNPVGSLLLGVGRADLQLKWNLAVALVFPPTIWLGSRAGPEGMAWALFALHSALFIPGWYFLIRPTCNARLVEYVTSALKPFLLAAIAIAPAYWMASYLDGAIERLVLGGLAAAPIYIALSCNDNREWVDAMRQLVRQPF